MTTDPFEFIPGARPSPWLLTCDHASNEVPPEIGGGSLGLSKKEMGRHIAWDIGAAGVTRALADVLGAPAVLGRFSRLVIDPNRGEDDPTLIMQVYDQTIVPGNRGLDPVERERRLCKYYRPYHAAVADIAARRDNTIYVAIHSFTPRLKSRTPRPWHVGILYAQDERFSRPFITRLRAEGDLIVGENEPYAGHLPGDSVDRHALQTGRPNALIELRHDLIERPEDQVFWAQRLARLLDAARADANL